MDDDLMARRLRQPSQPTRASDQQPIQAPSPWDVPFTPDGHFFAPPDGPSGFDAPFAPPDPTARENVPWDRPDPEPWPPAEVDANGYDNNQSHDPDDALAPVVSDVAVDPPQPAWLSTSDNSQPMADVSEPMMIAALGDAPPEFHEPDSAPWSEPPSLPTAGSSAERVGRSAGPHPVPEWPIEDLRVPTELTEVPEQAAVPEQRAVPEQLAVPEPVARSEPPESIEPSSGFEPSAAPEAPALPVTETPPTPPVTSLSVVTVPVPSALGQEMVLRIELAIVDETKRANPPEARGVRPDVDVRQSQYDPRNHLGGPTPEPEYVWDIEPSSELPAPPPFDPLPAPPEPMTLDWDLPPLGKPAAPDAPAPWAMPASTQSVPPMDQAQHSPAPTWAMTLPTPPLAPTYEPPAAVAYPPPAHKPAAAQPAWPASAPPAYGQLAGIPTAPIPTPAPYAPVANQPAAPVIEDDDARAGGRSSSILTAALTIGFALLVIVLVLVFVQLMTSLLR